MRPNAPNVVLLITPGPQYGYTPNVQAAKNAAYQVSPTWT